MVKCPGCGKEIDLSQFPRGLAYCPYCGQELKSSIEDRERLKFCPFCGQEIAELVNFCPGCGKRLTSGARPSRRQGAKNLLAKIGPAARSIRGRFGREGRMRKLYEHWVEYDALPPEEAPAINDTLQTAAGEQSRKGRPPNLYIALGAAAVLIIVIVVIILAVT